MSYEEEQLHEEINSLRTSLDAAEKELAAISAAVDVEYNGPNDKRSGDLLDDIGAFIEHHKAKEVELKQLKEANAELVKTNHTELLKILLRSMRMWRKNWNVKQEFSTKDIDHCIAGVESAIK